MTKIRRQFFPASRFEGLQPGEVWTVETISGVRTVKFLGINRNGLYVFHNRDFDEIENNTRTIYLEKQHLHTRLFRLQAVETDG